MYRHRRRNELSAARVWQRISCDWSMVAEDETVFLHQRGSEDRNYGANDETVIFDSSSPPNSVAGGGEGLPDETMIAKEIGKRIVEARNDDDEEGTGMCVVCQEKLGVNLNEGRRRRIRIARLDCGHQFHPQCIRKWLSHKNNCPLCKATVCA